MKKIIFLILLGLILMVFQPCSAYDVKGRDTVERVTGIPAVGPSTSLNIPP